MNKYFYIGKKEALKHQSMVYAVSDFKIDNHKEIHGENSIEYYGDNLPYYVTVLDDETAREATTIELYEAGIYELQEYEFINNNEIVSIYDFPIPEGTVKPVFNYENLEWIETATEEDIAEHKKKLAEEEYKNKLPLTVFDMDNRLYMTQDILDMLMFEMMSVQSFALKTMTIEKQEEYMTTQAFYYYDRIIQKEKREGLQSAMNYYNLVVSKFPQYKEDIDFLLIENDKEYIIVA